MAMHEAEVWWKMDYYKKWKINMVVETEDKISVLYWQEYVNDVDAGEKVKYMHNLKMDPEPEQLVKNMDA